VEGYVAIGVKRRKPKQHYNNAGDLPLGEGQKFILLRMI